MEWVDRSVDFVYIFIKMHANDQAANLTREIRNILLSSAARRQTRLTEQELANRFGVSRTPVRDAQTHAF